MSAEDAERYPANNYRTPGTALLDEHSVAHPDVLYSTSGRLGVMAFNARVLCSLAIILICAYAVKGIMASAGETANGTLDETAYVVGMLFVLVAMIASIFISIFAIKRLHDLNRSAWWLILNLIPVVNIFWGLYYWFTPGRTEPNTFGASRRATRLEKLLGFAGISFLVYLTLQGINA